MESSMLDRGFKREVPVLPGVWRGSHLAAQGAVCPSGHAALDAELPGGGWPLGAATELLQAQATPHIWQLLAPALARQMQTLGGPVVLVGPPADPFGPGLAARGLAAQQLLCVQTDVLPERLWAAEQALRCAQVAAVLAWVPAGPGQQLALRRLQQAVLPQGLLFLVRPLSVQADGSSARLRLRLGPSGADRCAVRILKRRGPPLAHPVELPQHPMRLAAAVYSRPVAVAPAPDRNHDSPHALDCALAA